MTTSLAVPIRPLPRLFACVALFVALLAAPPLRAQTQPEPPEPTVQINLADAPFDMVLDYLARQTHLPVIRQTAVPDAKLSFVSDRHYTIPEAIEIVNLHLQPHAVRITRRGDFLYFRSLADAASSPTPVIHADQLDEFESTQYVTVQLPLKNALAATVAEQLTPLVKEPGAIRALPTQNIVVLVETAAQARRLRTLIEQIDTIRPKDIAFRVFPIRYAEPKKLVKTIQTLVPEREQLVSMTKNNEPKVYDDPSKPPLKVSADDRLGAIVCVGPHDRITAVEDLIRMLDVPDASPQGDAPSAVVRAFDVTGISAEDAARQLSDLFRHLPQRRRPAIRALPQSGRVIVIADESLANQAADAIRQIDPGATGGWQVITRTIELEHLPPSRIEPTLKRMLSQRAQRSVRYTQAPSGRGFLAIGPSQDVDELQALIQSLDIKPEIDRTARRVQLETDDPQAVLDEALRLDALTDAAADDPIEATLDDTGRSATLVGSRQAIDRFERTLRSVQSSIHTELAVRTFTIERGSPSQMAAQLRAAMRPLLTPTDGSPYQQPELAPLDDLGVLVVRARPDQLDQIAILVARLKEEQRTDTTVRVLDLPGDDPQRTLDRALNIYQQQRDPRTGDISTELDADTARLIITGPDAAVAVFERALQQAGELERPAQITRVISLHHAKAGELARAITSQGNQRPQPLQNARPLVVTAEPSSNSLVITTDEKTHAELATLIDKLDTEPRDDEQPLVESFVLKHAEADRVAPVVQRILTAGDVDPLDKLTGWYRFSRVREMQRAGESFATAVVRVEADVRTNTVIVTAPADRIEQARAIIQRLDQPGAFDEEQISVVLRSFTVEHTDARTIAQTVEQMLNDRSRWPVELRRAAEIGIDIPRPIIRSDARTNRVIASLPEPLVPIAQTLIEAFDHGPQSGSVEVRVFRLNQGAADTVARAVRDTLSASTQPGEPTPRVSPEPTSNTIVITASPRAVEQAQHLIDQMDTTGTEPGGIGVRTVLLAHARAEVVAPVIERVLAQRDVLEMVPGWYRYQVIRDYARRGVKIDSDRIRVSPEPRLNALIISAPTAMLDPAEQLATQLDLEHAASRTDPRTVEILPLINADAQQVASNIQAVFADEDTGDTPPIIRVDSPSNALIVRASAQQHATIASLCDRLDAATLSTSRSVRTIMLDRSRVDAAEMARTLRRMLGRSGGVQVQIITADELFDDEPENNEPQPAPEPSEPHSLLPGPLFRTIPFIAYAGVNPEWSWDDEDEQPEPEPAALRIAVDPETNALIVVGSQRLTERVAQLAAELQDQMPAEPTTVRLIELPAGVNPSRTANLVNQTVRQIGRASTTSPSGFTGRVAVAADTDARALIVWSNESDFATVRDLIVGVARMHKGQPLTVRVYPLEHVAAARAADSIRDLVSPRPQGRRARQMRAIDLTLETQDGQPARAQIDPALIGVTTDPNGSALIVTAPDDALGMIDRFVTLIDQPGGGAYPLRSIKLEHADAQQLAASLTRFFRDRARISRQRGGVQSTGDAAIVGDARSGTIVVAASDDDYEQIAQMAAEFDTPAEGRAFQYTIIPLEHIRVRDIESTLQQIVWNMQWERSGWYRGRGAASSTDDKVYLESNEKTNSVVLVGQGETFDTIKRIIAELDQPPSELAKSVVKVVRAPGVDLNAIKRMIEQVSASPGWRWWWGADPEAVKVEIDQRRNLLLLIGKASRVEEVAGYIEELVAGGMEEGDRVETVQLVSARATELARALQSALPDSVLVKVTPIARTNALLLTGPAEDIAQVKERIAQLDKAPERAPIAFHRFVLEHAEAFEVAQALRLLIRNRPRGQDEPAPSIDSIDNDNTIVATATTDEMAFIAEMIERLDVPRETKRHTEFIKLEYANAEQAADALKVFYGRFAPEAQSAAERSVSIVPDPASNSLVISADELAWDDLRSLLETIDTEQYDTSQQLVVIPLKHASATSVARALNDGFRAPLEEQLQRERVRLEAERRGRRDRNGGPFEPAVLVQAEGTPTVSAEPLTNSLIVFAGRRDLEQIRRIVAQLDVPEGFSVPTPRVVRLVGIPAAGAADTLRAAFAPIAQRRGEVFVVRPDRAGNALVVTASDALFDQVRQVVAELDPDAGADVVDPGASRGPDRIDARAQEIAIVRLRKAGAAALVQTLRSMLNAARSDATTGRARALVEQVRRLRLTTDAGEPVELDLSVPIRLEADAPGNTILVGSTPGNVAALRGVIETLDRLPVGEAVSVRLFPLEHAAAERVRRVLADLFGGRDELTRVSGTDRRAEPTSLTGRALAGRITVAVDARTNTIVVAGPEESVALAEVIIADLDRPDAQFGVGLHVIAAPGMDVAQLAPRIERLMRERLRVERARSGGGSDLGVFHVEHDPSMGALIVASSAENAESVRALVDEMRSAETDLFEVVRRFPLESAGARDVVALLEDVLAGRSISGERLGGQATRVRVLSDRLGGGAAEATLDQTSRQRVTMTPDVRTNSVLVKAPPEIMDLIAAIVEDVDRDERGERVIEQFRLVNADATQMQLTLIDLFSLTQQGSSFVLMPVERAEDEQLEPGAGGTYTAIPDERRELSVTVDRRTNTLLVSGTRDLIEEVRRIVHSLDSIEANSRERMVYHLRNAQAAEVEATLMAYFRGESDLLRATLGPDVSGSVLRELEREVTVVGDANSNKLVISASPRYIDTVAAIIEELDASPPQVMIQVLIAEVTLDESDQWGVDISVGGPVGVSTSNGTQLSGFGGDEYGIATLTGGAGVNTALGVPNFAVGSSDFSLLVRALKAQGKLEVLSRPQVQVANNQEANIQVGEDVTVPVGTVQSGDLLRAETEQREVGIILTVTPTISADGFVRMKIAPEISDVSQRTTQIDENFEVPIITQRRVETTVTVKDGQSVVIGGLIQTSDQQRHTKTPVLGDLPLLGGLFRSKDDTKIKTELLVILTPYVIPGESSRAIRRLDQIREHALDRLDDPSRIEEFMQRDRIGPVDGEPIEQRWPWREEREPVMIEEIRDE